MTDEILVRLGLDQGGMARGLQGAYGKVQKWGSDVRSTLSKSLGNAFSMLAAPLSIAGLGVAFNKVLGNVERVQQQAEALDISTSFVQDLNNISTAAGLNEEATQKMLAKWAQTLPAGADVETEFRRMADRLAEIPEGAERARAAVDAFGKAGINMLPILSKGSKGLDEMAAQFAKFSDTELKELAAADEEIDKISNRLTIWTGKFIGALSFGARTIGRMSTDMKYWRVGGGQRAMAEQEAADNEETDQADAMKRSARVAADKAREIESARAALAKYNRHIEDLALKSGTAEEKVQVLNKRIAEQTQLATKEKDPEKQVEHYMRIVDLEEQLADVRKKATDDRQKALDAENQKLERQREAISRAMDAEEQMLDARKTLAERKGDRSKFGLEELSELGIDRWTTGAMAQQIQAARRARWLERQGRALAEHGREAQSQEAFSMADKIRSGLTALTSSERQPFGDLEKSLAKQEANFSALLKAATESGITVRPAP